MNKLKLATASIALILSTNTSAALIERLGGQAYYDDVANLTWLADANAAGTTMNWADANNWVASLNIAGVTGWRLPTTPSIYPGSCSGPCDNSEMGNMFYNVLGGVSSSSILNSTDPDLSFFSNLQSNIYWSDTYFIPDHPDAWVFNFNLGDQYITNKIAEYPCCTSNYFAWAVHSGDVSAVPVPAAVWLFGSGLIGLAGFAKRKKT